MNDRRPWRVLLPVFAGLILAGIGSVLGHRPLVGIGFLISGLGAGLGVVDAIRAGVIRTNWGTIVREKSLLRFRIEAAFWILFVAAWLILSLLYTLGLLARQVP